MAKKALMVRLDKLLIQRLSAAALRYKRRSGNEVVAEVVDEYLDLWLEAEEAKRSTVQRQRRSLTQSEQPDEVGRSITTRVPGPDDLLDRQYRGTAGDSFRPAVKKEKPVRARKKKRA